MGEKIIKFKNLVELETYLNFSQIKDKNGFLKSQSLFPKKQKNQYEPKYHRL